MPSRNLSAVVRPAIPRLAGLWRSLFVDAFIVAQSRLLYRAARGGVEPEAQQRLPSQCVCMKPGSADIRVSPLGWKHLRIAGISRQECRRSSPERFGDGGTEERRPLPKHFHPLVAPTTLWPRAPFRCGVAPPLGTGRHGDHTGTEPLQSRYNAGLEPVSLPVGTRLLSRRPAFGRWAGTGLRLNPRHLGLGAVQEQVLPKHQLPRD